jgi:acetyl esterase/lipase
MKKYFYPITLLLISLCCFSQESTENFKPVELPINYTAKIDVIYTQTKDWEGKTDLYLNLKSMKPTPVIINIHGGGWNKGVKESQTGFNTFFNAGFAVANMEYRLSQKATAPAAVEDTRCMIIYLIRNAKKLNIDPTKIVIMGGSAGGHLALMGGLLGNDSRFDTNCKTTDNVQVAAIIDKYGITDLYDWSYGVLKSKSALQWLGTKVSDTDFIKMVSPISYITEKSPPIFIVHGDSDPIVPYQQSVDLYKKLQENGVKSEFITVTGGLHGKFEKEKNADINIAIIKFLRELNII